MNGSEWRFDRISQRPLQPPLLRDELFEATHAIGRVIECVAFRRDPRHLR
jgi:hypothetical protein